MRSAAAFPSPDAVARYRDTDDIRYLRRPHTFEQEIMPAIERPSLRFKKGLPGSQGPLQQHRERSHFSRWLRTLFCLAVLSWAVSHCFIAFVYAGYFVKRTSTTVRVLITVLIIWDAQLLAYLFVFLAFVFAMAITQD